MNFCPQCGHRLHDQMIDHKVRSVCESCGFVYYLDPKVAVAVIVSMDGKILLNRRAIEPGLGLWSFPSGYVDRGEVLEDAAVREVREETNVAVKLTGLVGVYSRPGHPVVLAVYKGTVIDGSPKAGPEASEVGLFPSDELPPLAFEHDQQILADWRASLGKK